MINWGLANTGGFQNALSTGLQMGQFARQRQEEREGRNALSAFIANPNDQTAAAVAPYNPRLAYQYGQDQRAASLASRESALEGLEQFRPLLEQAMQGPEQWAQALRAATDAGYDLSGVPRHYDREWAQGQLMILEAAKDPERLDRIGRAMQAYGYTDPSQPGYDAALQEFTRMTFAREGTNEHGQPILVFPDVVAAGDTASSPQAPTLTYEQYRANFESMGRAGAEAWLQRNGGEIRVQTREQVDMLPSGTVFVTPDGRRKVKP